MHSYSSCSWFDEITIFVSHKLDRAVRIVRGAIERLDLMLRRNPIESAPYPLLRAAPRALRDEWLRRRRRNEQVRQAPRTHRIAHAGHEDYG